MKENISINGNETIEELVKKVTTVESIDDKFKITNYEKQLLINSLYLTT